MRKQEVSLILLVAMFVILCLPPIPKVHAASSQNLICFCENGTGWPAANPYALRDHLSDCVNNLANAGIQFADICDGYWNATNPAAPTPTFNGYAPWATSAWWTNVIDAFHARGIKVIAFVEDGGGGTMNLTASNIPNIYNEIKIIMAQAPWDGYSDDTESYSGTQQDWLNYINGLTPLLHGLGKLNMPWVGYDWQRSLNPNLHVDYILTMFYGASSLFDPSNHYSSQATGYWKENFGIGYPTGPPASPLILTVMNFPGNTYNLAWQLTQLNTCMSNYGAPQMVGLGIWNYEYMASRSDGSNDWAVLTAWISNARALIHDVAVRNVTSSKTVVGQRYSLNVNVTVGNPGDYSETFNITLYANATAIGNIAVTNLPNATLTSIDFVWNTTGFAYNNYTISAYAWPVAGETNTANNNLTAGTVYVGIPGDVNGDGTVNILDAIALGNAFLATPSSPNWNPNADINGDGIENVLDAIILGNHFLQHL
jgi:hypothetical protein